jgi:hypothetical protein
VTNNQNTATDQQRLSSAAADTCMNSHNSRWKWHAALARRREPAALVETRAHAALNCLDDRLVLHFHAIEAGSGAAIQLVGVKDVAAKHDARAVDRLGLDRLTERPWIEIEHEVREHPPVERRDAPAMIGRSR